MRLAHCVAAVTTYNRLTCLKKCLTTWDKTRSRAAKWTLIVVDDGSDDGSREWVDGFKGNLQDVDCRIVHHSRQGVHEATNAIFRICNTLDYDFAFKMDDDIYFIQPGWDDAYYAVAKATGYHHLCYFNQEFYAKKIHRRCLDYPVCRDGMRGSIDAQGVFGCLWTFTPRVLEVVGFFDTKEFGTHILGHIDFTSRCCRAGFNDLEHPFDLDDSDRYVAMDMNCHSTHNPRAIPEKEYERRRKLIDEERLYVGDSKVFRRTQGEKSVLLFDKFGDHIRPWLGGFESYAKDQGFKVVPLAGLNYDRGVTTKYPPKLPSRKRFKDAVSECSHVFMWGGEDICCQSLKEVCNEMGIPWSVLEVGWFPQSSFWTLDEEGINARSSLMHDDLSWVTDEHLQNMQQFREQYIGNNKWVGGGGYILVPLQLDEDSNIVLHSPFKSMQEFVNHCEWKFRDQRLVFKMHPKFRGKLNGSGKSFVVNDGSSFLDAAKHASLVYGINSTCLLEAALAGCPVEAIGDGFLKAHAHQKDKLLAALVDRQIPVGEADLDYWLKPAFARPPREPSYPNVQVPANGRTDFVMAAYKMEDNAIRNFLRWNGEALQGMCANLIIVTDRHIDWLPPWAKAVVYPQVEQMSLSALINFGIRRSSAEYVVKTDVDIIISPEALAHLLKVRKGRGIAAVCSYIDEDQIGKVAWPSLKRKDNAYGAFFAMYRGDWYKLRGYNENLVGWGMDDEDMVARAIAFLDDFRVEDIGPVYHINHPQRKGSNLWPERWHANHGSLSPFKKVGHQPVYDGIPVSKDDVVWKVEEDAALAVT